MVGATTGAGAGLQVRGGIDTSMIERGFDRVRQSFDGVKSQAKSFTSDIVRMDLASGRLVNKLAQVGTIGTSAIIGLASKAPAVAGSIAKMSVEFDRLARILGTQFKSEFETASNLFTKFVNFVRDNEGVVKGFVFGATAITGLSVAKSFVKLLGTVVVGSGLKKVITFLGGFTKIAGLNAAKKLITTIGAFIAPVGLATILGSITAIIAAGGIGSVIGEYIGGKTYEKGGVSEDVARWITEHPKIQAGIEAYAGIPDYVYNMFRGMLSGDKEDNRRDQLLTPQEDLVG